MKISTKGQYALRIMIDLATRPKDELVSIKALAEKLVLPEKYLEQIVSMLTKAGYLKSVRGAKGGYRIAGDPASYTAGMIIRDIEGPMAPVSCLEETPNVCPQLASCTTISLWKELYEAINGVLDSYTLADLAKEQIENSGCEYMI